MGWLWACVVDGGRISSWNNGSKKLSCGLRENALVVACTGTQLRIWRLALPDKSRQQRRSVQMRPGGRCAVDDGARHFDKALSTVFASDYPICVPPRVCGALTMPVLLLIELRLIFTRAVGCIKYPAPGCRCCPPYRSGVCWAFLSAMLCHGTVEWADLQHIYLLLADANVF
jgi:hypothetical protein